MRNMNRDCPEDDPQSEPDCVRDMKIHNIKIVNNKIKDGWIQNSLDHGWPLSPEDNPHWSTNNRIDMELDIDSNTYDAAGGFAILRWAGQQYSSLDDIRSTFGWEMNGSMGTVLNEPPPTITVARNRRTARCFARTATSGRLLLARDANRPLLVNDNPLSRLCIYNARGAVISQLTPGAPVTRSLPATGVYFYRLMSESHAGLAE
jgi:hypothetical protein